MRSLTNSKFWISRQFSLKWCIIRKVKYSHRKRFVQTAQRTDHANITSILRQNDIATWFDIKMTLLRRVYARTAYAERLSDDKTHSIAFLLTVCLAYLKFISKLDRNFVVRYFVVVTSSSLSFRVWVGQWEKALNSNTFSHSLRPYT